MWRKICKLFVSFVIFVMVLVVNELRGLAAQQKEKPGIIWIFLDQQRADALSCYGHPFVKTPNIDRIAQNGVMFTNAFVTGMPCVPSRACYMSGLYPHQIDVYGNNDKMRVEDAHLPRVLKKGGFEKLSYIGKVHLGVTPEEIGFTKYIPLEKNVDSVVSSESEIVTIPGPGKKSRTIMSAHTKTELNRTYEGQGVTFAINEYEELKKSPSPFIIFLSLNRPHPPAVVPSPYYEMYGNSVTLPDFSRSELDNKPSGQTQRLDRFKELTPAQMLRISATYYGLTTHIDDQIGRLLKSVEKDWLEGKIIIIVSADHGCYLGEHGMLGKGNGYREATQVPLIISWPRHLPEGKKVTGIVESIDLIPTLTDIYGIFDYAKLSGQNLMPLMLGKTDKIKDAVYNEDRGRKTIRTLEWHYSKHWAGSDTPEIELYDLKKDPAEKVNLANKPEYREIVAKLDDMINKKLGKEFPGVKDKSKGKHKKEKKAKEEDDEE